MISIAKRDVKPSSVPGYWICSALGEEGGVHASEFASVAFAVSLDEVSALVFFG